MTAKTSNWKRSTLNGIDCHACCLLYSFCANQLVGWFLETHKKRTDQFRSVLFVLCITSVYYLCIIRVLCVGFHRFSQVFAVLKNAYLLHFLEFALLCCFLDRNRQPRKINAFSAFCVLCVLYHWGCMWLRRAFSFLQNNLCPFILSPAAYRVKKLQSLLQDRFVS